MSLLWPFASDPPATWEVAIDGTVLIRLHALDAASAVKRKAHEYRLLSAGLLLSGLNGEVELAKKHAFAAKYLDEQAEMMLAMSAIAANAGDRVAGRCDECMNDECTCGDTEP